MKITKYPERILVYEAIGFLGILAMVMIDEIYEVPKRYFVAHTSNPGMWEGSFEVIFILAIAIAILLMTNRLVSRLFYLEGLLKVCAWCGRIHHEDKWISMERYFSSGFDMKTTHGMCPDCFERTKQDRPDDPFIRPQGAAPGRPSGGPAPPTGAKAP